MPKNEYHETNGPALYHHLRKSHIFIFFGWRKSHIDSQGGYEETEIPTKLHLFHFCIAIAHQVYKLQNLDKKIKGKEHQDSPTTMGILQNPLN